MTRAERMADLLAALEVERFTAPTPTPRPELEPISAEQAAANRALLLDALSSDPVVVAWTEKRAAA